MKTNTIYLA